jgi:hypothetical protein
VGEGLTLASAREIAASANAGDAGPVRAEDTSGLNDRTAGSPGLGTPAKRGAR